MSCKNTSSIIGIAQTFFSAFFFFDKELVCFYCIRWIFYCFYCIGVYCSWFWVVLVGLVSFVGGFGWFWLVLLVVLGGFGWFWLVPCFSNYGLSAV